MRSHVYGEVTPLGKTLPAHLTLVRFLLSMGQRVHNELVLIPKTFSASIASERLLSSMDTYVFIQRPAAGEHFPANLTHHFLDTVSMLFHMSRE